MLPIKEELEAKEGDASVTCIPFCSVVFIGNLAGYVTTGTRLRRDLGRMIASERRG